MKKSEGSGAIDSRGASEIKMIWIPNDKEPRK